MTSTERFTTVFIHPSLRERTIASLGKASRELKIPVKSLEPSPFTKDGYLMVQVPRTLAVLTNRERLAYETISLDWSRVKTLLRVLTLAKGNGKKRKDPWYYSEKYGNSFLYGLYINGIVKSATGKPLEADDYRLLRRFHKDAEVEPFLHGLLFQKRNCRGRNSSEFFVHADDSTTPLIKASPLGKWLNFRASPAELPIDVDSDMLPSVPPPSAVQTLRSALKDLLVFARRAIEEGYIVDGDDALGPAVAALELTKDHDVR